MPPRPGQRTRRITALDNATSVPKRVTFPTGTFISNPSTAADGAFGAPFANTPERLPYGLGVPVTNLGAPTANWNTGFAVQQYRFGEKRTPPLPNASALQQYRAGERVTPPTTGMAPVGYGPNANQFNRPPQVDASLLRADQAPQILAGMAATGKLPGVLNQDVLKAMQAGGFDTAQLAQFYVYNPNTGGYSLSPEGQALNTTAGGNLQPGQYVDAQGTVQQGATPFGTNASGQRLDIEGNVWDPNTANRDIYGGKFIQVGEVRWERNKKGRLIKVQHLGGGKKKIVAGGSGQSQQRQQAQQPQQQQVEQAAPTPAIAIPTMYQSSVNFNTASG